LWKHEKPATGYKESPALLDANGFSARIEPVADDAGDNHTSY
jgi:hypothetical protein